MNTRISKLLSGRHEYLMTAGVFLLRLNIGLILFAVGAGKVLGLFGGKGMAFVIENFGKIGISPFMAYLSSYTEFLGGLLLLIGLFTRPAAFAVAINMAVATWVLLPSGIIGGNAGYPLTFFVIALVILLTGPMQLSLDHLFMNKKTSRA